MITLHNAIKQDGQDVRYKKLEEVYADISELWKFSFSCRFFASLIHLAIENIRDINEEQVEYIFKLRQGDDIYQIPKA